MSTMRSWKKIAVGGAAALTLAAGLTSGITFATQTASAQADDPAPIAQPADQVAGPHGQRPEPRRDGEQQTLLAEELGISVEKLQTAQEAAQATTRDNGGDPKTALATELGITVAALQAAHEAVAEAQLAQALADGRITQEEYDLRQAHRAVEDSVDREAILAGVLGITVDELQAARAEGVRLPDLLAQYDVEKSTLDAAMQSAFEDALKEAVADNTITQEQADALASQKDAGRHGPGPGGPGGERDHGRGGPGLGDPGDEQGPGRGGPGNEQGPGRGGPSDDSGEIPASSQTQS